MTATEPTGPRTTRLGRWARRVLLLTYPAAFRSRFADELLADYERVVASGSKGGRFLGGWRRLLRDTAVSAPREHVRRINRPGGPGETLRGLPGEVRGAWRNLRATPAFSVLVILTLALGMGPTTAAYSLANWLLLRPVPGVVEPDRLGIIQHGEAGDGWFSPRFMSYANLLDITPKLENLEGLGATQGGSFTIVFAAGKAQPVAARFVTPDYFATLGLRPVAGRFFGPAEDDPVQGGAMVAVLSHRLAMAHFDSVEVAVGHQLTLNRHQVEIVGVLPAGFHGLTHMLQTDIWVPGASQLSLRNVGGGRRASDRAEGAGFYEFVGRLAPGATWEQAEAELNGLSVWLAELYPEANESLAAGDFHVYPGLGTQPAARGMLARSLGLLMAIAGCVLLVACANVSNLLFLRAVDRRGEACLRKALGASSATLICQAMLEALMLCALGTLLGLGIARGLAVAFDGASLSGMFQPIPDVPIDWRVALFAGVLCVGVTVIASLLPALGIARVDPARWIAGAGSTATTGARRLRAGLVAVQLAAGVPLVVGALLFTSTLAALAEVDLGFEPGTVRLLIVQPGDQGYDREQIVSYQRTLYEALEHHPAINSGALASGVPFANSHITRLTDPNVDAEAPPVEAREFQVTRNYFEMLGVPILAGRTFLPQEQFPSAGAEADVAVLDQALAQRLFGDDRAVGQVLQFPFRARRGREFRVVGVVGNVRSNELVGPAAAAVYLPFGATGGPNRSAFLLIDGDDPSSAVAAAIAVGAAIDPLLPVVPYDRAPSLAEAVAAQLSERVLLGRLFAALAAVALLLAAIGVYGTAGRTVATRRREIGVRMALGADATRVLRMVFRSSAAALLVGVLAGSGLALFGTRFIESQLYGVSRLDPVLWSVALVTLLTVGSVAAAVPAGRAARIDPVEALRG